MVRGAAVGIFSRPRMMGTCGGAWEEGPGRSREGPRQAQGRAGREPHGGGLGSPPCGCWAQAASLSGETRPLPGHLLSQPGQGWPQGSLDPEEVSLEILEAPLVERPRLPSRKGRRGDPTPRSQGQKKRPCWTWNRGPPGPGPEGSLFGAPSTPDVSEVRRCLLNSQLCDARWWLGQAPGRRASVCVAEACDHAAPVACSTLPL